MVSNIGYYARISKAKIDGKYLSSREFFSLAIPLKTGMFRCPEKFSWDTGTIVTNWDYSGKVRASGHPVHEWAVSICYYQQYIVENL